MSQRELDTGGGNFFDGSAIEARSAQNVLGRIYGSQVDAELSDALRQLIAVVTKARDQMPDEQQQIVAVDLGTVIAEANSSYPRRESLRVAGEGLIMATAPVKGMTAPVLAALEAVCSLLSRNPKASQ